MNSAFSFSFLGLFRLPVRRHWIFPKDKFALSEHMDQYVKDDAKVLELFSCYETILPPTYKQGVTVGVGWSTYEMSCNPSLDDFIEQDISIDPYLPLADNYFDFVVVPAMFQLFQRPKEMFEEINRVLKPGGTAFVGVKLAMWSFLGWKQGRYFVETNYVEDVLTLGSFFHYAKGFTKPEAFDLTLPEFNIVGKVKDTFFPQPRLDFYAVVQAKKKKNSPHGKVNSRDPNDQQTENRIEGAKYAPKIFVDPVRKESTIGPFY